MPNPRRPAAEIRHWLAESGDESAERTAELLAATIGAAELELVDRAALFSAWRRTIGFAAARRPLVLVIEDLHWSSDSLLDLVEFILQPAGDVAMLMVALARPELLDRRPGWGGGRRSFVSLALEPLADAEVATLVGDLLEDPVPDLVGSVVATGRRQPVLRRRDRPIGRRARPGPATTSARWTVSGQPARHRPGDGPRPARRLPPTSRRLLQLGSVFGRSFRVPGISRVRARPRGRSGWGDRRAHRPGPDPGGGPRRLHVPPHPHPRGGLRDPDRGPNGSTCTRRPGPGWRHWPATTRTRWPS